MLQCLGSLDDKKLTMAIDKGFDYFDKDKSGSLDAAEAREAASKALALAGPLGQKVTPAQIDGAFTKIAGSDQKMDKEEVRGRELWVEVFSRRTDGGLRQVCHLRRDCQQRLCGKSIR